MKKIEFDKTIKQLDKDISPLRRQMVEKIEEKQKMTYGMAGTERTSIKMKLSDTELVEFSTLEFNEHYSFKIDKNFLTVTYTE